ncbi:MAG: hypothetical protein QM687_13255 [Ferruginibacter sp.]
MKTSKKLLLLAAITLFSVLCSFMAPAGGEGFEIYVDNKLVIQKFNKEMNRTINLDLSKTRAKAMLDVKFYHCGMAGSDRVLTIKDVSGKLLKQWQFANSGGKNYTISIPVNEIFDIQRKTGDASIYLYYASKETTQAKLLTAIVKTAAKTAAR